MTAPRTPAPRRVAPPKGGWQARWFHLVIWVALLVLFVWFLRSVEPILLPFVLGMLVAYLMDPAAHRLQKMGLGRTWATAIITVGLFAVLAGLIVGLVPMLYDQLTALITKAPQLIHEIESALRERGAPVLRSLNKLTGGSDPDAIPGDASELVQRGVLALSMFSRHLWASGAAILNVAALLLITPVVCFYLIRDWPSMVQNVDRLLPVAYAPTIRQQIYLINRTLAAYIRGQVLVMLLLAIYYVVAFMAIGLNFALVLGVFAGFIVIIPYIGSCASIAIGLVVAYSQFGMESLWWVTVAIYGFGQVLEQQILVPKVIGERVGLHPVWLLFGMLAGGVLLGFTGVLLAVPITAVIGVLTKFVLERYLQSSLYLEP